MYSCLCIRAHTCCTRTLTIFNVFWTLKLVHLRLPIRTNLVNNFVICMSVHLRLPTVQNIIFCDVCAFALTHCAMSLLMGRHVLLYCLNYCEEPIGSLKSLRPETPNHNKVVSPNQSLLVYSSGILDNTVLPSICSRYICKVSYGRTGWHQ